MRVKTVSGRMMYTAFIVVVPLIVFGCGNGDNSAKAPMASPFGKRELKLDGTNADTLSASIAGIVAEMTEAERKEFGENLQVFYSSKVNGVERLVMYPDDYVYAISSVDYARELAIAVGTELNGMTPSKLSDEVKRLRRESVLARIEVIKKSAEENKRIASNVLACVKGLQEKAIARGESAEVAMWSQASTSPLDLRNLNARSTACSDYIARLDAIISDSESGHAEAATFDFGVPFDMEKVGSLSNLSSYADDEGRYCTQSLINYLESACGSSFR